MYILAKATLRYAIITGYKKNKFLYYGLVNMISMTYCKSHYLYLPIHCFVYD